MMISLLPGSLQRLERKKENRKGGRKKEKNNEFINKQIHIGKFAYLIKKTKKSDEQWSKMVEPVCTFL